METSSRTTILYSNHSTRIYKQKYFLCTNNIHSELHTLVYQQCLGLFHLNVLPCTFNCSRIMFLRLVGNNSIPLYVVIYSIIYTKTYNTYLSISFHGNRYIVNIHKNVITAFPNIINIKTLNSFF